MDSLTAEIAELKRNVTLKTKRSERKVCCLSSVIGRLNDLFPDWFYMYTIHHASAHFYFVQQLMSQAKSKAAKLYHALVLEISLGLLSILWYRWTLQSGRQFIVNSLLFTGL